MPLDYLEEVATGCADLILVNSSFTAGVFGQTFKRLAAQGVQPAVLHPAVAVPKRDVLKEAAGCWQKELDSELVQHINKGPTILSINRCWLVAIQLRTPLMLSQVNQLDSCILCSRPALPCRACACLRRHAERTPCQFLGRQPAIRSLAGNYHHSMPR